MLDLAKYANKKLCVALSGGVDSVCLLHYLLGAREKHGFFLVAVHCEHGIRGAESLEDMAFVQALCKRQNVPLYLFQDDCVARAKREKSSVETAARAFRKECFAKLLAEEKAAFIVTAHHSDDEAETVLFRIARGAALSGAGGMKEADGNILRPFLDWKKEDIYAYAKANGLEYRVDKTNFEKDATRNKLRLEVFPSLENAVAGAKGNFARFAKLAREDDAFLYRLSERLITTTEKGLCVAFCEEKPLFRRACLTVMKRLGLMRDYTAAHLESLYLLQRLEKNAKIVLPQGVESVKTKTGIVFYKRTKNTHIPEVETDVSYTETDYVGGMYAVNVSFTPFADDKEQVGVTLRLDGDTLPKDAVWRTRKEGDYFEKFGGGKKTIKKFFNEKEIPIEERAYLPLLASNATGEVYAVCGVEIAERVKVTEKTKKIVYLRLIKRETAR